MSDHNAVRPGWLCGGCGQPWPCGTRKTQLLAEYDGAPACLGLLMRTYFCTAARELTEAPAGDLYTRFLGWLDTHRGPARTGRTRPGR